MARHRQRSPWPFVLAALAAATIPAAVLLHGTPTSEPAPAPPAPAPVRVGPLDRCPPDTDLQVANEVETYCVRVIPPPAQLPADDPFTP